MRCPFCGHEDTQVKDSRPTDDNSAIRRRRYCPSCGSRFTTFERVQLRELTVVKKNGQRVPFDRDKLARSIPVALPQAAGRSRAHRAHGQRHRAAARKLRRERDPLDADRRAGDGRAARARSGGLCALRLGLSQLPRGQGLRGVHRRARRDATSRTDGDDARGARAGAPVARAHLAQSGRRLRDRARRPRDRPRLDAARRPAARRNRGARAAGEAARGATVYVTLEPCSHHGVRRPAPMRWCAAGVGARRVGAGGSRSRGGWAGPSPGCATPASRSRWARAPREAAEINAGFLLRVREGRPLVHLKLATRSTDASPRPRARATGSPARRRAPTAIACAPPMTPSWSAPARSRPTIPT